MLTALLALALQGPAPTQRLPVAIYPILDHQVDSVLARRLTGWLVGAFHRDTSLIVLDHSAKSRPRRPRPAYAVVSDLERAPDRSPRLALRVVDVASVNLVGFATVTGTPDSLQRALPALADQLGERLRTLRALPRSSPPPHWQVPTEALKVYSRGLSALDQRDTSRAIRLLREALRMSPKLTGACDALKRLVGDSSTSTPRPPGVAVGRKPPC